MRTAWLYLVALGSVGAMLGAFVPGDESDLPDTAPRSGPRLVRVEGLAVDTAPGLPAWRAARAVPDEPAGPLALGGQLEGLRLEDVVVELDGGLALHADSGAVGGGALTLERVQVAVDGRRLLVAGAAAVTTGRIRFPGVVAWFPGEARERVERDLTLDLDAFAARLSGR